MALRKAAWFKVQTKAWRVIVSHDREMYVFWEHQPLILKKG